MVTRKEPVRKKTAQAVQKKAASRTVTPAKKSTKVTSTSAKSQVKKNTTAQKTTLKKQAPVTSNLATPLASQPSEIVPEKTQENAPDAVLEIQPSQEPQITAQQEVETIETDAVATAIADAAKERAASAEPQQPIAWTQDLDSPFTTPPPLTSAQQESVTQTTDLTTDSLSAEQNAAPSDKIKVLSEAPENKTPDVHAITEQAIQEAVAIQIIPPLKTWNITVKVRKFFFIAAWDVEVIILKDGKCFTSGRTDKKGNASFVIPEGPCSITLTTELKRKNINVHKDATVRYFA